MANHPSAAKRHRQSQSKRLVNQMNRNKLRTQLKKIRSAVAAGDGEEARQLLPKTFSLIDKSVQKGVLKRNAARRRKSRISRNVNAISS